MGIFSKEAARIESKAQRIDKVARELIDLMLGTEDEDEFEENTPEFDAVLDGLEEYAVSLDPDISEEDKEQLRFFLDGMQMGLLIGELISVDRIEAPSNADS